MPLSVSPAHIRAAPSQVEEKKKTEHNRFPGMGALVYLEDLLASLSPLHNLTCHTQILQHSPLAFEPTFISNGGQPTYLVEEEELKAFINDADWNLGTYNS